MKMCILKENHETSLSNFITTISELKEQQKEEISALENQQEQLVSHLADQHNESISELEGKLKKLEEKHLQLEEKFNCEFGFDKFCLESTAIEEMKEMQSKLDSFQMKEYYDLKQEY